jgi:hypothetical protein
LSAIEWDEMNDEEKLEELKRSDVNNEALDEPDLEQRRLFKIAIQFQQFYVDVANL